MKITSTTLIDKPNIRRPKDYRENKSKKRDVPAIAIKSKRKISDLVDPAVVDLTGLVDLNEIVVEEMTPKNSKKAIRDAAQEAIQELLVGLRDLGRQVPRPTVRVKKKTAGTSSICCLFSDWHFGKVIKTKSGSQIFNSDIAYNRVTKEIKDQIIDYIRTMAAANKVDEIRLLLAGDMVDNDIIYPHQRLQIDTGVAEQFHKVIRAIMVLVSELREEIKALGLKNVNIYLDCLTGNHGRATKNSETPICSWDTAAYSALDLAIRTAGWKDVEVTFSLHDFHVTDIKGHRVLMKHHAPPTSESTTGKKVFGGLNEIFDYDLMVYGDLHHWAAHCYNGKPLLMNGSLCGYDDYAIQLGVRDDWSQLIWIANEQHPVNYLHRLERK